jgi:hypothetical protein
METSRERKRLRESAAQSPPTTRKKTGSIDVDKIDERAMG